MRYIVFALSVLIIVCSALIVSWTKHQLNDMAVSIISLNQLAMVERGVLLRISKLELRDSIDGLNKLIESYEQAIEANDPPEHISAGIGVMKLDIERREILLKTLDVIEKGRQ